MNAYFFYVLLAIAFVAAVCIFIAVMIELRATTRALSDFVKTADSSLRPTIEELQRVITTMRSITDNAVDVTEDVKAISGSMRSVGENLKHVSELVEGATSSTAIEVSGLKAGIRAAKEVLLKNLGSGKA
jgi:uncharacterized protein YoxC